MRLKIMLLACASIWICLTAAAQTEEPSLPVFSDYRATVSMGPFSKTLTLTVKQKSYSDRWKKKASEELNSPVNFAGKYRLFTYDGLNGKECSNGGVCGWVVDKLSGQIVSELPAVGDSNVYNQIGDNGTPTGIDFNALFKKDSTLLSLTAQTIPKKMVLDTNGYPTRPPCETNYYKFESDKFTKIFEDKNGCNID